jgi:hypothetical protein
MRLPQWCSEERVSKPGCDKGGIAFLSAAGPVLTRRINLYRRAYARGLGCRPTALQSVAIRRAATLQVQSEVVLADPTATVNDRVRITGAARRALLDMQAALASKPEHHALTLGELLRNGA